MAKNDYLAVHLEEIRDEVKATNEGVAAMRDELERIPKREEFDELKLDVKVIKAAITDLSSQVSEHEQRVTRLEAA